MIKDKRKRPPRLAAVLRAKGEEDDLAFAVGGFGEGGFAVEVFFAEHPARKQGVFCGVTGDGFYLCIVSDLKRRAGRKIGGRIFGQAFSQRGAGIDIELDDRAGIVKFAAF